MLAPCRGNYGLGGVGRAGPVPVADPTARARWRVAVTLAAGRLQTDVICGVGGLGIRELLAVGTGQLVDQPGAAEASMSI
jgi:hypothetical protein